MKLKLSFLFFLFISYSVIGQQFQLSPDAKISVLTIGPGISLNDSFGHNAFRVLDLKKGVDVVYGYGEYDFEAPYFILKFARGKLNYLISRHNFSVFYNAYARSNRTIHEQILNLTDKEKQNLLNYLENNYKPQNRRYLYDFFYDNCATRIKDVTKTSTKSKVEFTVPKNFQPKTFRKLIHEHVGLNTWGSFGIDIALGSVIDREATVEEHMFLPKYINLFFAKAKLNTQNLAQKSSVLFEKREDKKNSSFFFSPLMLMSLLALMILYITYKDSKNKRRSQWLDITLFSITGIVGVVILLLWFATDHTATAYNYNLLWAFPLNIVVICQLLKNKVKNWLKGYLKFLIIMLCLMTLHWVIGVQVFAIGLIPLLVALIVRYIYLLRFFNQK